MNLISTRTVAARDNPFASHRVEAVLFCFAEGDWNSQIERLKSLNWRGAILGNQGSGKTTLMLELKSRLDGGLAGNLRSHYCFVARNSQEHPKELEQLFLAASRGCVLLVDGIERMGWFQRRRLLQHKPNQTRLLMTAHRPGGLPLWIHCRTDWPLMQKILGELIDSPNVLLEQESRRLFELNRGNIREVLRGLYDLWSSGICLSDS